MNINQQARLEAIEWTKKTGISLKNGNLDTWRNESMKAVKESWTPKNASGVFGVPDVKYFIDQDRREFNNLTELGKALAELGRLGE